MESLRSSSLPHFTDTPCFCYSTSRSTTTTMSSAKLGTSLRISNVCRQCRAHLNEQQWQGVVPARPISRLWSSSSARERPMWHQPQRMSNMRLSKHPEHVQSRSQTTKASKVPSVQVTELSMPILQAKVNELADSILRGPSSERGVPDEKDVLNILRMFERSAEQLLGMQEPGQKKEKGTSDGTATSALLSSVNKKQNSQTVNPTDILQNISRRAISLMEHPSVFLTSAILKQYISLQSLLGRPQTFPHILNLYRTKPAPRPQSTAPYVTYQQQNPSSPSTAIPPTTADMALAAAIKLHTLPLCLSIIDETYCTTSYARSKILRSALFPVMGALFTPLAAYTLATRFAMIQDSMDPSTATGIAMAGIMTYTAAVGTIGYVALTTANDQMVRVTWASGIPLWERWIREEERGAVDKVAQAWGFSSIERWGEEEGRDWDELREWIGVRGMILDRVSLMEGME